MIDYALYAKIRHVNAAVYDIATIREVRASSQFRVTMDANTYSVPARYAGKKLTMKLYPDRLCLYDQESLIARHGRSYDHHQDFENPDHPKELLLQRKKARDQQTMSRFLSLSPQANNYLDGLLSRRLNPNHHVAKIVALADLYGVDAVASLGNIELSFVGSWINIAASGFPYNAFEPDMKHPFTDPAQVERTLGWIFLVVGIVEELDLNTRIWSKQ